MADTTQMAVAKGMLTVDEQNRFTDRLITLMDNDEELSMILEGAYERSVADTELEGNEQLTDSQMNEWLNLRSRVQNNAMLCFVLGNG